MNRAHRVVLANKAILYYNNGGHRPLYISVCDFSKQLFSSVKTA